MTSPRVQRHRKADANRRKVRTVGTHRIGQQARISKKRKPYRKRNALSGLSFVLSALSYATGSVLVAIGAVASSAGAAIAWRIEYQRQLAEVKATGRPIGAGPKAGDPLPAGVTPVDLDSPRPAQRQPQTAARARKPTAGKHGPPGHEATCTAKTPQACPYWRKANHGRAKTATTRKRTRK